MRSAAREGAHTGGGAAARGRALHGRPRGALGLAGLGAAAAKHSCARTPPRLRLAKGASHFGPSGRLQAVWIGERDVDRATEGRVASGRLGKPPRPISHPYRTDTRTAGVAADGAARGARRRFGGPAPRTSVRAAHGLWDRPAPAQAGLRPAPSLRCGPAGARPPPGAVPLSVDSPPAPLSGAGCGGFRSGGDAP